MIELKEWLNSINFTKENLLENIKDYSPYIINRCLSGYIDCVMYANEMNMHHHLDKDLQYSFYLNSLRKKKRFSPWIYKDKIEDLEYVKKYYGYSNEKAQQSLNILNKDQIEYIKLKLAVGGLK
jgi:hypothetical protein